MNDLENDMIIRGTTTRLLNESEIRTVDIYQVVIENNGTTRLVPVEQTAEGTYIPQTSESIIITEEGTNGTRKLSEYNFLGFVTPVLYPNESRQRAGIPSKNDRLAKLFEGISPEDITEFLKGRT